MTGHFLTSTEIERFRNYLREEEKSKKRLGIVPAEKIASHQSSALNAELRSR